jgi:hypothetical protein
VVDVLDWRRSRAAWARLLEARTGKGVDVWMRRIARQRPADEASLRAWLRAQGVTGYPQSLLVMERFGYPDHLRTSGRDLIAGQYEDRPGLRPVYDAAVDAASRVGDVAVQARKGYVSLVTPRRTFARVRPTTKRRLDLFLRLDADMATPGGRFRPSRVYENMGIEVGLATPGEVDGEIVRWLQQAYDRNR